MKGCIYLTVELACMRAGIGVGDTVADETLAGMKPISMRISSPIVLRLDKGASCTSNDRYMMASQVL